MPDLLSVFVVAFVTLFYFLLEGITNVAYIALLLANSLICLYFMFEKEDKPFTLQKIVNLFCYIFFVIANGVQFARHTNVLTFKLHFADFDFVIFQGILFCLLILYNWIYAVLYKSESSRAQKMPLLKDSKVNYSRLLVIAGIATVIVLIQFQFNPAQLMFRGTEEELHRAMRVRQIGKVDNSGSLMFDKVIRPMPFVCIVISLISKAPKRIWLPLLAMTFVTNSPTGLARNAAAMIWLPIIVLLFGKYLRHNLFMWLMMFALFVLFPFFNLFRRWNGNLDFEWSMDFFNDINFDASQLFMATIKTDFITWGEQLLGVLLFWFPRKFWEGKPGGSGHRLVHEHNGWWENVSMPYFSEGYVNFGFIGIILFTILLAWFTAKFDGLYWSNWRKTPNLRTGYYLILLGALVFILRGDMLSSIAYTIGIMISYSLCLFLSTSFHFTRLRLKK